MDSEGQRNRFSELILPRTTAVFASMQRQGLERAALIAACALMLIPLLIHGYVGSFMRLFGDDYCYTNVANTYDLSGTIDHVYRNRQARVTSNALLDLLPAADPIATPALPFALMLLSVLAFVPPLISLLRLMRVRHAVLAALMLSLLLNVVSMQAYQDQDRAVGMALMWRSGMTVYVPPRLCLGLTAGVMLWAGQRWQGWSIIQKTGVLMVLTALTFIGGGASETYAAMLIGLCAALMPILWLALPSHRRGGVLTMLMAVMLGAGLALWVLISAPTTQDRVGQDRPDLGYLVFKSVYRAVMTADEGLKAVPTSILLLIVLPAAAVQMLQSPDASSPIDARARWLITVLLPLAVFAAMICASAPSAYVGEMLYPRVQTISVLLLTFAVIVWSVISLPALRFELDPPPRFADPMRLIALLVLILMLVGRDLGGAQRRINQLRTHAAAWDQQDAAIREAAARGETTLRVAAMKLPWSNDVLTDDPDHWVNLCVAEYYGIESIIAE